MKIEYDILSALIYEPKEISKVELDKRWFFDSKMREIANQLIGNNERSFEPNAIYEDIRNANPNTLVTAEMLDDMRIDGFGVRLEENAKSLKKRFYKEKFDIASRKYASLPNFENFNTMKDALRELESIEKSEDDGSLKGAVEKMLHELETEPEKGIKTYPKLDHIVGGGLFGGMLITIGAGTGQGKTAYTLNLVIEAMSKQPDLVVDFFTLEMSKLQMLKRFVSRMSDVNSMKLRNPKLSLKDNEKARVTANGLELLNSELRIHDGMFHINQIERQIRRRHFESSGKPYIAFIDYLGLVEASDKGQQRYLQVGEITRTLKLLTNELNIPIVLLSQINRGVNARQDKKPTLSDLRESASIEQDSNVVILLHQDEEDDNNIIASIAKNREGFTGDIKYNFLRSKMYFEELDD